MTDPIRPLSSSGVVSLMFVGMYVHCRLPPNFHRVMGIGSIMGFEVNMNLQIQRKLSLLNRNGFQCRII
jgi:hypothetical protein